MAEMGKIKTFKTFQHGRMLAIGCVALGVLAVSGCATPPEDPEAMAEFQRINDPLEPTNRYIFGVNQLLDFMVLGPVADTYRTVVPEEGQKRVSNVLNNMGEPLTAVNTLLQGRAEDTGVTLARFVINSTIGLAGIFDVATEFGLEEKRADFGQTLYTFGFEEPGPYLVMPVFGPSNPRDAVGFGVDSFMDPTGLAFSTNGLEAVNYGRAGGSGVSQRAEVHDQLDSLRRTSIDFYAQLRSISRQRRQAQLSGERTPDFEYDIYSSD